MEVIYPSEYTNPLFHLPNNQTIVRIPDFELECGKVLKNPQVAFKTFGKLNETRDNVLVICHALSGSCDVEDWWGSLLGPGKPFDPTIFFIFCGNVLGSPYGSASPITINPDTGHRYGPSFPLTTLRDDVRIHKYILDQLKVKSVEYVIGGSLGGMQALEWAFFGKDYVHNIIAIATSSYQSAWGISWNEAQRQAIFCDPNYKNGFYTDDKPPYIGLSNARVQALLTYRSGKSFQKRFGRKLMPIRKKFTSNYNQNSTLIHNEGCGFLRLNDPKIKKPIPISDYNKKSLLQQPTVYSAQSYLRYQGNKFVKRFDANCYIALTRKLDCHDIARDRFNTIAEALQSIEQNVLVVAIETDGLFSYTEQSELANNIPHAEMHMIQSEDGHDGFLLEFQQMINFLNEFMKKTTPKYPIGQYHLTKKDLECKPIKSSTFGEIEIEDDEEEEEEEKDHDVNNNK
jgi:homoserine O-acetyltransferase